LIKVNKTKEEQIKDFAEMASVAELALTGTHVINVMEPGTKVGILN
jgi:hypothetical protein